METKLKTIPTEIPDFKIYCVMDVCLPDRLIDKIIAVNKDYFNLFTSSRFGIGVACIKLQLVNKSILMRTFDSYGNEAATYKLLKNYLLKLYKGFLPDGYYFIKDGLNLSLYDEKNQEGNPFFQVLDNDGLDPIGDGFTLNEGIYAINTYWNNHLEYAFSLAEERRVLERVN